MSRSAAVAWGLLLASPLPAAAQVTRVEILSREPAQDQQPAGKAGAYEILRGRIHGEVDRRDRHNVIIQDVAMAPRNGAWQRRVRGDVCAGQAHRSLPRIRRSHLPGRQSRQWHGDAERLMATSCSSAAGRVTSFPQPANQTIDVPEARSGGSAITGPALARFYNVTAGTNTVAIRLSSMGSGPPPYQPAGLEQPDAVLTSYASENCTGREDWRAGDSAGGVGICQLCRRRRFPARPIRRGFASGRFDGFDPARLYELAYTVTGSARARHRPRGNPRHRVFLPPCHERWIRRRRIPWRARSSTRWQRAIRSREISSRHSSTSASTRICQDAASGMASFRALQQGKRPSTSALRSRAARRRSTSLAASLSSGGAATSIRRADERRRAFSIAVRQSRTCPKVVEAFGAAEFWGLRMSRMSPGLIGTDAKLDIPLPDNVRRYYYPGTTHGGGRGGFRSDASSRQSGWLRPAGQSESPG